MPPISNYNYKLLDKPSYDRYQVKISNINNVDPYGMDSSLFLLIIKTGQIYHIVTFTTT